MSIEFNCVELEDFFSQDSVQQSGITVWVFLEMMNSGKITKGIEKSIISMAIEEAYREIVGDVLKEVGDPFRRLFFLVSDGHVSRAVTVCVCWFGRMQGYLWKKGQLRRNWKERWFTLRPSSLCYYTGEDRKDCQGNIALDGNCCVEVSSRRWSSLNRSILNTGGFSLKFVLKKVSYVNSRLINTACSEPAELSTPLFLYWWIP